MFLLLALLASLSALFSSHLASAAPWPAEPIPERLQARQTPPKAASADALGGINWFYAWSECHGTQYADLQRAFMDVTDLAYATIPAPHGDNPSFVDFFGIGYSGPVYGAKFWKIFENLQKAGDFPVLGKGSGESNKISVRCADVMNKCSNNPWSPNYKLLAYTGWPANQPGTIMVFCDAFWREAFPHLMDRVQQKPTHALADLITMEHVILHELMHADVAGYQEHIEDIRTVLPGETDNPDLPGGIAAVAVYGVRRCKKLAQQKNPNLKTLKNADSYAWFASSMFFSNAWGFTVDENEGFVEGSADPIPEAYTLPDNGNFYADDDFGDDEWTS